jgi:hypothetical protein
MVLAGKLTLEMIMKKRKEIVISPNHVVTGLIVFLVLVTAGFIFVPRLSTVFVQKPNGMTAEAAARAGTEAFLSVDGRARKDDWIKKICQVSTPTGCKLAEEVYAPMVWPSIQAKGLRFSCKTVAASHLESIVTETVTELWELKTVCTNLDTGETNDGVTQVFVSGRPSAGWKFERVRFDQEIQK